MLDVRLYPTGFYNRIVNVVSHQSLENVCFLSVLLQSKGDLEYL